MITNEISHVFLALDLTEEILAEAIEDGADMILTHHPMIFSGIKKINNHNFTGRKIMQLIQKGYCRIMPCIPIMMCWAWQI